ncbi:MAG: NAD(P)-dependent alcohol dehydrogenase [Gammaproteobacteria bacterium]|nr:MAG: NAD(P)-dependent alcohol dehydrogenase [Gammaproteobacteria bacterium]TLY99122.1 MAG: NAD(P)-dependent alcohol dehydrogenase [Gammaproteobacteria bacterium]
MKAAVITRYGSPDAIKILDAPKPAPGAGEVLIRVHATTVSRTDCGELRPRIIGRLIFGLRRPRRTIFGMDFAGVVEAVGAEVMSFKPGDRVFGMCPSRSNGAQAEYVCIPERAPITIMPANMHFDEAVACEGAFYANSGLRKFHVGPGHKILIYGASGAIGLAAVQLAKAYGAEVTAVVATQHLDLVKSLGADRAIDYTAGDFTRIGETFDFVFEAVGKTSFFRCRRLLKPKGTFMATDIGPWGQYLPLMIWSSIAKNNRVLVPLPPRGSGHAFVEFLKARMEAGQFRAVIDRRYSLDEIADAYCYVETGQKVGIVVINVAAADESVHIAQDSRIGTGPSTSVTHL